ncbi:hypothetical protein ACSQ67_023500 [Phaseolus vulgaris]
MTAGAMVTIVGSAATRTSYSKQRKKAEEEWLRARTLRFSKYGGILRVLVDLRRSRSTTSRYSAISVIVSTLRATSLFLT